MIDFDNLLYVIGNGFDRHHGVRSSYLDFRDWLKQHHTELYSLYDLINHSDEKWSNFEAAMPYLGREYFLKIGQAFLPDYNTEPDDWQIADLLLGGDHVRCESERLLSDLLVDLHKWVQSIKPPHNYDDFKLKIDPYARFLSFNYTTFLQSQYGIEYARINYIHGNKNDKLGSLILGHNGDSAELFEEWWDKQQYNKVRRNKQGRRYKKRDFIYHYYEGDSQYLPENEFITEAVEDYYNDTTKKVKAIIQANDAYFQSLHNVRHIYVWGFSFSSVDMPYLKKIAEVNAALENTKWHISHYTAEEATLFKQRLHNIGVSIENIEAKKLSEF